MNCVWKPYRYGYKTACGKCINKKMTNWKYCPYCGKVIALSEYRRGQPVYLYSEHADEIQREMSDV